MKHYRQRLKSLSVNKISNSSYGSNSRGNPFSNGINVVSPFEFIINIDTKDSTFKYLFNFGLVEMLDTWKMEGGPLVPPAYHFVNCFHPPTFFLLRDRSLFIPQGGTEEQLGG